MSIIEERRDAQLVIAANAGDETALRTLGADAYRKLEPLAAAAARKIPITGESSYMAAYAETQAPTEVLLQDDKGDYYGVQALFANYSRPGTDYWQYVLDGFVIREYGASDPRRGVEEARRTTLEGHGTTVIGQRNTDLQGAGTEMQRALTALQVGLLNAVGLERRQLSLPPQGYRAPHVNIIG